MNLNYFGTKTRAAFATVTLALFSLTACVSAPTSVEVTQDMNDVTGSWNTILVTPEGERPIPLTITNDGGVHSGTFGGNPIDGLSVDGATFSFENLQNTPAGQLPIRYTGEVNGDTFNGQAEIVGFGVPPLGWSGTRE